MKRTSTFLIHRLVSGARRPSPRGQGLVELAILLPVLALLLVMALDFGRVFFGWVALQNASRQAADFAAGTVDTWGVARDDYQNLVANDLIAINCRPPTALDADGDGQWDPQDVPDPSYVDMDGNGPATDDGDHASVRLDCRFDLLTPLAQVATGGPVALGAEASFPIWRMLGQSDLPDPEPPPPGPCPEPTAMFEMADDQGDPTDAEGQSPLTVTFTDTSFEDEDCPITQRDWTVDGAPVTLTDGKLQFVHPGPSQFKTFVVELTVTTDGELTSSFTDSVRVQKQ